MAISRRTLLGAAAALAAGGLTGCATRPAVAPTASATPVGPAAGPTPPDWAALRARLAGTLVLPDEPGYDTARRCFDTIFDARRPAAVATCATPADVQACLEVGGAARLPVAARSGGHSYAGYCVPEGGLVVDLSRLSAVDVGADGSAVIGPGARLGDVYTALAAAGRCLPAGTCPTVGVGGLTLGGGIGVLTRAYGLTCDRVSAAEVVTADTTLRTASAQDEPELFWALRGGGGGNGGVVTAFTFATVPAPPAVTVFSLRFGPDTAADVLAAWQDWVPGLPDELWTSCTLSSGAAPQARIAGAFVGGESGCRARLDALLAGAPPPTSTTVSARDYLGAMRFFAGGSDRQAFVASSRVLPGPLDPDALIDLLDRPGIAVLLDSLGGAVSRVAAGDTAFPHRTAFASAQVYATVAGGDVAGTTAKVAAVRDGLGALTGPTGYVNYIDPAMPDWERAYYGDNLPRLREVVGRYDPGGVLRFAQGLA